ncbi:unnamed protein product, partial [Brassica oleracea]
MPASVAIAASFPELSGNLASATVAESPSASVPEQAIRLPPSSLEGQTGKALPSTSPSTELDPASKWRSQLPITSSKQIYMPKDTGTTSKVPEKAVPNDPRKDLAVTNQVPVSQDTLLLASDQLKSPQINKAAQNNQKQTFAEVSASTTRKSDPITKGSVPYRSLLPQISTPKTSKANPSSSIIAFDYDVSRGGLVVDLSPHFTSSYAAPSDDESYSSQQCLPSPETLSEGDDNPDDENDQFIQDSVGVFGDPGISDHSPCCIYLDSFRPKQKKPFKFFSMLNSHLDFAEVVKQCWTSLLFAGSKMLLVSKKLKELK